MKSYYLAMVGGQLLAFKREAVAGVAARGERKRRPPVEHGREVLRLAQDRTALICDLQPFLGGVGETGADTDPQDHYLIIMHREQYLALIMTGKGRLIMLEEEALLALPPAFSGPARQLVQGVLLNGADVVFLLDSEVLLNLPGHAGVETKTTAGNAGH